VFWGALGAGVAVSVLGLVLIVVMFIKDNIPEKSDIEWFTELSW
jgi:cytochrome b subunit of formate dehydrogenase